MASDRSNIAARPLDRAVLPVADLATARARLKALGFTVAPDGVHPFGTANCCVYFADGTFLESQFGIPAIASPSLRAVGLVFGVAGLKQTEALLRTEKVAFERRNGRLIIRPAPGQGATFIFEESE